MNIWVWVSTVSLFWIGLEALTEFCSSCSVWALVLGSLTKKASKNEVLKDRKILCTFENEDHQLQLWTVVQTSL